MLLSRWKLPEIYQKVVKEFRDAKFDGQESTLIKLLELSHLISKYIVTDRVDEIPKGLNLSAGLSLSEQSLTSVINEVVDSKDNIKDLATMIAG